MEELWLCRAACRQTDRAGVWQEEVSPLPIAQYEGQTQAGQGVTAARIHREMREKK